MAITPARSLTFRSIAPGLADEERRDSHGCKPGGNPIDLMQGEAAPPTKPRAGRGESQAQRAGGGGGLPVEDFPVAADLHEYPSVKSLAFFLLKSC